MQLISNNKTMKLNVRKILAFFMGSKNRARVILNDKKRAQDTVRQAFGKALNNKGNLNEVWEKMQLLFGISKDYLNGSYPNVPIRSIVAIIGGLIYFLSPIDVIPDFVPFLGFADDIFILNLVYRQVIKDVEKYKIWKDGQTRTEDVDVEFLP